MVSSVVVEQATSRDTERRKQPRPPPRRARCTASQSSTGSSFATAVALFYFGFHEERLDVGDMVQAIWSTTHGRLLEFTTPTGQQASRLGVHTDVFLLLLVPFWLVWHSALLPLVMQPLAIAAGALPVYWLARKHLGSERAAAHVSFAYLLFPATQFSAFTPTSGFHPISFAVPIILFAIWFLDEDRLVPFAVCALLAATTKEEIPLAVGCLGIWYAVAKGKRKQGVTIFVAGVGLSLLAFLVVIPHFSKPGYAPFAGRYASVGGSPRGILHTAVTDPGALLHTIATPHKAIYLLLLLVPFLGLSLLAPLLLLGAVPDLVINLLSGKPSSTAIGSSYTGGLLPFLIAATIFGMAKLKRDPRETSLFVLVAVAAIAINSPIRTTAHAPRVAADVEPRPASAATRTRPRSPHRAGSRDERARGIPVGASLRVHLPVRQRGALARSESQRHCGHSQISERSRLRWMREHPGWKAEYKSNGVYVLRR